MTRQEQIIQAAKQEEKKVGFAQIVKDAKGINSAYGIGFLEGVKWADKHSIEVKDTDVWHLQEKEDIYDAIKGWGNYTFACLMKDGTIQKFIGSLDEDCEGNINTHIDGVNDDYDDVDDIVKWIEIN